MDPKKVMKRLSESQRDHPAKPKNMLSILQKRGAAGDHQNLRVRRRHTEAMEKHNHELRNLCNKTTLFSADGKRKNLVCTFIILTLWVNQKSLSTGEKASNKSKANMKNNNQIFRQPLPEKNKNQLTSDLTCVGHEDPCMGTV